MKKLLLSLVFAATVAAPLGAFAQVSATVSGTAGVGVAPAPITIAPPVFDNDTSNDDIVQLNNLQIQNISGTQSPVIISASSDYGVHCLRYQSESSPSGIAFPCPMPPSILYQIRVDDTILLLRNRARARISDFAAGDRINVYGFMDRNTQTVDALIMRDLDKPVVKQYIQMNNVVVVTPPSRTLPSYYFTVTRKLNSPCLDYGQNGVRGIPIPCPLGQEQMDLNIKPRFTEPAPNAANSPGGDSGMLYYLGSPTYVVRVLEETKILDSSRSPISISDIQEGDILNIYGEVFPNRGGIHALIIRNLSKPQKLGLLQLTVADGSIVCMQGSAAGPGSTDGVPPPSMSASIMAPCGILYNATVQLYGNQGLVGTRTTEKGTAFFENLPAGQYMIVASAPGYDSKKQEVFIREGTLNIEGITIIRAFQTREIHVRTDSDLMAYIGQSFSATFTGIGGQSSYDWKITAGELPPGLNIIFPPMARMMCPPNADCLVYKQTNTWISGIPTKSGMYKFTLTAYDTAGNSGSETFIITVADGLMPVPMKAGSM